MHKLIANQTNSAMLHLTHILRQRFKNLKLSRRMRRSSQATNTWLDGSIFTFKHARTIHLLRQETNRKPIKILLLIMIEAANGAEDSTTNYACPCL